MKIRNIFIIVSVIVCSACQHATKNPTSEQQASAPQGQWAPEANSIAIMSINDVYRISGIDNGETGGLARVRALRKELETKFKHVLFLHAGDFLHPSFISKQDNGLAMIKAMNMLDGQMNRFDANMLVTWGNHEFDKGGWRHVDLMNDLLAQSEFTWLDSNINWATKDSKKIKFDQMQQHTILDYGGIKIGVFSFTTDIAHPDYVDSFDPYKQTAEKYVPMLREQGADFVIGLTHQWLQDDLAMMELPKVHRPDIIFGGHEHYVQTHEINGNWVLKADADAASAIVTEVIFNQQGIQVIPQVIQLDSSFKEDLELSTLATAIEQKNDADFCMKSNKPADCLTEVLGKTQNKLIAEETEIRRFETNLGNLLADTALAAFESCDADVALLNSGSIRLNQNIPAGSDITVKHLEEMFPYSSDLRLIEFNSKLLEEILAHSISGWTANGHWLQVAGLAYIHNPELQSAEHIHLKNNTDAILAKEKVRAVVPYYLIADDTDHDGYIMINESMQVDCQANGAEIKQLFTQVLKAHENGINVKRDMRICNSVKDSCLE